MRRKFVQARTLIIQKLVRDHGFRTVALEADFGGAATANDYVMKGRGSAQDAATALGFDIYRTREMSNLIEWIHDHNAAAADADKVRLYGFDMQRYDRNKERLLRYLATVDPARVRPVEDSLAALTDATRSEQDKEKVAAAAIAAERLVAQMKDNREKYVSLGSEESFVLAVHHAETIRRGAQLRTSGNDYAGKRDAWMAENVGWIADVEGAQGRKKIIVSHTTSLAKLFGNEPLGYVNLAQASTKPGNRQLLASEVRMGNVGDGFRSIYSFLSWTYTVKTVPAEAYDALVYVPKASPVTPL